MEYFSNRTLSDEATASHRIVAVSVKPIVFVLSFFALCFAARIIELFVIRTDLSVVGEAFIHKLFGIALLAAALFVLHLKWRDIGFRKDRLIRGVLMGALIGAGAFAIAYGVEMLVNRQNGGAPTLEFYVTSYGLAGNSAMQGGFPFILICVAGNLTNVAMEDGVFRGLFMRVLGSRYSFIASMMISSAIFGIWHGLLPLRSFMDGGQSGAGAVMSAVLLIVTGFIFGVELCLLCKWEGALWAGMTVHFINNASVNLLHVTAVSGADELQTLRIAVAQTLICLMASAPVIRQWGKPELIDTEDTP
jgi:membrane protease YdiL (CAAX protease family)